MKHDFRKPVFVRNDEVSQIEASVVVWDARMDIAPTIKFTNGNSESVLIDAADWDRIKAGFADGALKSKTGAVSKVKADPVVARYKAMVNRRDKWAKEAERANRLLKKAEAEVRTYERRHGERLKP